MSTAKPQWLQKRLGLQIGKFSLLKVEARLIGYAAGEHALLLALDFVPVFKKVYYEITTINTSIRHRTRNSRGGFTIVPNTYVQRKTTIKPFFILPGALVIAHEKYNKLRTNGLLSENKEFYHSEYDRNFWYNPGEIALPRGMFDMTLREDCGSGLHVCLHQNQCSKY